jgi:hypothetical protein
VRSTTVRAMEPQVVDPAIQSPPTLRAALPQVVDGVLKGPDGYGHKSLNTSYLLERPASLPLPRDPIYV